ncbi:hypothetical protein FNO01nite_13080 [Flavobacterium noncentrifugens]|uniref:DUF4595 domain-containing protein n=1 Tax=Flavobacterium noncentrifugens TaxID=1128970 RepID=A0A1G8VT89_9FLAO|nr:hypothetical protein [Flavobacterium noncentrifugens]GEP50636.1 hypothetical protein FNO01nite_13080 [Flavobacterium noncentrifugens]SDJ69073.1 hypothetical protein SAMN04487935_1505 [Flavobacterium noncentrifugens]
MKKLFFILAIAFSVLSCSDDDNNTQEPQKVKLVQTITYNGDAYGSVEYDAGKKVRNMTFLSDGSYVFTYDGEQIATLLFTSNSEFNPIAPKLFTFSYDGNGKINKVVVDNLQKNVVYTAGDNSYYITDVGTNLKYRLYLDSDDDITKATFYNNNQVTIEQTFTHESGKGCMLNANRISTALAIAYPQNDTGLAAFLSKKAIKTNKYMETQMNTMSTSAYANVFDADGFIVSGTEVLFGENQVTEYQYTQL